MSIQAVSAPSKAGFSCVRAAAATAPLTEAYPAQPGDALAASAFLLGWALAARPKGLIVWAAPEAEAGENGAWCAQGLAQFGADARRIVFVRGRSQEDALWASEQALEVPGAISVCVIASSSKPLSLSAARRLILRAQTHDARALLLRLDGNKTSAAWTRWRIGAEPSVAEGRLLGPPRFCAVLDRNRAGPAGASWTVEWNAHERSFAEPALAGAVAAAAGDGAVDPRRPRAA